MFVARVISKGRITIPAEVRKALAIEEGDDLLFEISSEKTARLRVIKRRRLSDLFGTLPSTRTFPGKEEVRNEVGEALGKEIESRVR